MNLTFRIFIAESDAIAYKIIYAQVCSALLNVIANTNAPDSQNYAAATLNYLAKTYKGVYTAIKKTMGSTFLDLVLKKPDTFYLDLTREQCNFLRANSLKIVDKSSTAVNSSVDSDSEGYFRMLKKEIMVKQRDLSQLIKHRKPHLLI